MRLKVVVQLRARYIPWGKVWKKALEIFGTGVIVVGIDTGVDAIKTKETHMVPYVPPYPVQYPNHPAHPAISQDHDHDTGFILMYIGGFTAVSALLGMAIAYIVKTCKNGKNNMSPKESMEMA